MSQTALYHLAANMEFWEVPSLPNAYCSALTAVFLDRIFQNKNGAFYVGCKICWNVATVFMQKFKIEKTSNTLFGRYSSVHMSLFGQYFSHVQDNILEAKWRYETFVALLAIITFLKPRNKIFCNTLYNLVAF